MIYKILIFFFYGRNGLYKWLIDKSGIATLEFKHTHDMISEIISGKIILWLVYSNLHKHSDFSVTLYWNTAVFLPQ